MEKQFTGKKSNTAFTFHVISYLPSLFRAFGWFYFSRVVMLLFYVYVFIVSTCMYVCVFSFQYTYWLTLDQCTDYRKNRPIRPFYSIRSTTLYPQCFSLYLFMSMTFIIRKSFTFASFLKRLEVQWTQLPSSQYNNVNIRTFIMCTTVALHNLIILY